MPSRPNAIRQPKLASAGPVPESQASAIKTSFTSASELPSQRARATAVVAPFSPGFEYARYSSLFSANRGCRTMSIRPARTRAWMVGRPAIGSGSRTPLRIIRRRPARSVTSIPPSGRKAMLHGCDKAFVMTTTRVLCCSAVSTMKGPSPSGATGTPICWNPPRPRPPVGACC